MHSVVCRKDVKTSLLHSTVVGYVAVAVVVVVVVVVVVETTTAPQVVTATVVVYVAAFNCQFIAL